MDLEESWQVTRFHLNSAFEFLPIPPVEDIDSGATIESYELFFGPNELALALDQLIALGHVNTCGEDFWHQILAAAENMQLDEGQINQIRRSHDSAALPVALGSLSPGLTGVSQDRLADCPGNSKDWLLQPELESYSRLVDSLPVNVLLLTRLAAQHCR